MSHRYVIFDKNQKLVENIKFALESSVLLVFNSFNQYSGIYDQSSSILALNGLYYVKTVYRFLFAHEITE